MLDMEIQSNDHNSIFNKNRNSDELIEQENEYRNNFIPYKKMDQYINEYNNYFYSTKNSEIENSKINIPTNIENKQIINLKANFIEKRKKDNDIFNLPDDFLIEYNNRKRLDELRQKYLSNSSLRFLRKKDEIKKINPIIKKEETKRIEEEKCNDKKNQN